MIYFLEFKLNSERNIMVNIANVLNVFEQNDGKAMIVQSEGESFAVDHTYKEVQNMLTYFDEIKLGTI